MPCRTRDTSGATSHRFDIRGDFRGQPPRRRNVASVMGWAVEAVADYVETYVRSSATPSIRRCG